MKIPEEEGRECTPNDPKCSWQPAGVKLKGLALRPEAENNELCKTMVIPELQYTDRLKLKQWPKRRRKRYERNGHWLTPFIFEIGRAHV